MKTRSFFLLLLLIVVNLHIFADDTAITILFTGDSNGHPLAFDYMGESSVGGMAARAALIKSLTGDSNKKNVMIVDTGGISGGRPESSLYKGAVDLEGMKQIGYELSAVGFSDIMGSRSSFEVLNNGADFYFLCANMLSFDRNGNEEEITDGYFVKKFGLFKGVKLGFFGLISPEAANYMSEEVKAEYSFSDPVEKAKEMVKKLRDDEKVDLVICLSYLGYYGDNSKVGSQTIASQVEGIDMIIDGRTGLAFEEPVTVKGTPIFQTLKYGLAVGEINFTTDGSTVKDLTFKQHPVNYSQGGKLEVTKVEEDEAVKKVLKRKMWNYEKLMSKKIVSVSADLESKGLINGETAIGNLICDAMVSHFGVDAAFQNAGGLAEATITDKSELNRSSFNDIFKYNNTVYLALISGKELKELIRFSSERLGYGNFLQVGGISYKYSKSQNRVTELKVGGEPLDESKSYKIAFNNYLAGGGDGYKQLKALKSKDDMNITISEVVYQYLATFKKSYTPVVDGRIVIEE